MDDLSCILLAGGRGNRFGGLTPKQFLPLEGKAVALHSFEVLQACESAEVVVVCEDEFRSFFDTPLFAKPGEERQDSVKNGLTLCSGEWILVHDSARPFIDRDMVERVYLAAKETGAAALGLPMTATVKEVDEKNYVRKTLDRQFVWEIQTPQIVKREFLEAGFALGKRVTDDVSLAELAGNKVQLIEGSRRNLKITTPEDLLLARGLCAV